MENTSAPIRYAIYTRQSVDKGDELASCEVQFITCQDFAEASGEPGQIWIGRRFDDPGCSGATLDRPGLQRLRKVIALGRLNRVYAVALDRLSRRMRDVVTLLDEFDRAGIELRLVHQGELTSQPHNRLLRHVLGAFAEFERDIITTRIAESCAYLKKHARRLAGPPPFGYDADPATKQLIPNRQEARRVRAIFKRAAQGQTPREIAARVNHLGWRTKRWVSHRSGKQTGGGRWTARLVARLLRSPVYLGQFADGNHSRPGCHQAIVQQEVFEAVQARLTGRRAAASPPRVRHYFPLRGKIICPKCNRPLTTYILTKPLRLGSRTLRYYRCRSSAGGRHPCLGVSYPAWEMERTVRGQLEDEATWTQILRQANRDTSMAAMLAALWKSLGASLQDLLLHEVVENVRLNRTETRLRTTLNPSIVDIITGRRKRR